MSYTVRLAPVVDFRGGYDSTRWSDLWEEFHCDWRELRFNQRVEPPSWMLADEALAVGHRAEGAPHRRRQASRVRAAASAEVLASIREQRPDVVFAPHVETSSGIVLPDAYLRAVADAVHSVGGLFVLDCIACSAIWVDMAATGVDVLISAPRKGWSDSPCCAFVMVRALLARKGLKSVAAAGFEAPGVAVSYTDDAGIQLGKKVIGEGLQTAAGVPLQCDEGADFSIFRIGLFGLDKLHNVERMVANLERALGQIQGVPADKPSSSVQAPAPTPTPALVR